MKKLLLTSFFLGIFSLGYAQLTLTMNGFRNESDTTLASVVHKFPNQNADEIYTKALAALNRYRSSEIRTKEILLSPGASIFVSGESEVLGIKGVTVYAIYAVSFDFKDGAMKYSVDNIKFDAKGSGGELYKVVDKYKGKNFSYKKSVWSENGTLVDPEGKKVIEDFYNGFLEHVLSEIEDWERW
ncbi:hypothetical protein [Sphingobacterium suaedae]|uniref:DUF4468 domain-containing protein n=1 Tax=Sphingobacterium suaedae TaxID=1686402 RepID=A0ABW5KIU0_9SPHI